MYFGVAALVPPQEEGGTATIVPILHNLTDTNAVNEAVSAMQLRMKREGVGIQFSRYTHAFHHDEYANPEDCKPCIAALNQTIEDAAERRAASEHRASNPLTPPPASP